MMFLKTLLLSLICSFIITTTAKRYHTIDDNYNIREVSEELAESLQLDPLTVAVSSYIDNRNTSGWTYYAVQTNSLYPDGIQTHAAGYLEASNNYEQIWAAYNNRMEEFKKKGLSEIPQNVSDFIQNQLKWIEIMIAGHVKEPYWDLVSSILAQMHGLYDGYQAALLSNNRQDLHLTFDQFYILTYQMDLPDILSAFNSTDLHLPSCEFLLKITEDGLFGSHATWGGYTQLIRTYKVYNYSLHNSLVKTKRISFSSQPGSFSSLDDFYILDSSRVVTETTLEPFNNDVYNFIHHDSLPYWIRITLANLVFTDQKSWADAFFQYRSGTYNNQWLIIDFNNYNLNKDNLTQAKDIIWIVEEFYNLTSAQDVTQELLVSQGYVAGYNIPYNSAIQEFSKNPTNYTTDPMYYLFKEYAPGIKTFEDFKNVMRMNNISDTGDYCKAIASRCDLSGAGLDPEGSFDCKITNDKWVHDHQVWLISGPTTNENLPPFSWDDWPEFQALEMPRMFNFDWEFLDPEKNFTSSHPNLSAEKIIETLRF